MTLHISVYWKMSIQHTEFTGALREKIRIKLLYVLLLLCSIHFCVIFDFFYQTTIIEHVKS